MTNKCEGNSTEHLFKSFSENQYIVWVIGSSIIKHAFTHAKQYGVGINLGLDRFRVNIWWQGISGMKWCQVFKHMKTLLCYEDPPQILVIHASGNDIGQKSAVRLRFEILDTSEKLTELMPITLLVWSQVLP